MDNENKRSLKNFLIYPKAQLKMLSYILAFGVFFNLLAFVFGQELVVKTTHIISDALESSNPLDTGEVKNLLSILLLVQVILNLFFLFFSLVFFLIWSHRFYGAQYKMVQIIREKFLAGQYQDSVRIREEDHLHELSDALEDLRIKLREGGNA